MYKYLKVKHFKVNQPELFIYIIISICYNLIQFHVSYKHINKQTFLLKTPCIAFDKRAAMTTNKLPLSIRKLTFCYWSLNQKG